MGKTLEEELREGKFSQAGVLQVLRNPQGAEVCMRWLYPPGYQTI